MGGAGQLDCHVRALGEGLDAGAPGGVGGRRAAEVVEHEASLGNGGSESGGADQGGWAEEKVDGETGVGGGSHTADVRGIGQGVRIGLIHRRTTNPHQPRITRQLEVRVMQVEPPDHATDGRRVGGDSEKVVDLGRIGISLHEHNLRERVFGEVGEGEGAAQRVFGR